MRTKLSAHTHTPLSLETDLYSLLSAIQPKWSLED